MNSFNLLLVSGMLVLTGQHLFFSDLYSLSENTRSFLLLAILIVFQFKNMSNLFNLFITSVFSTLLFWKQVPFEQLTSSFVVSNEVIKGFLYSLIGIFLYVKFLSPKSPASDNYKRSKNTSNYKRRIRSYPRGYPNGWYMLEDSKNVKKGDILNVEALGKNFAVFRGLDDGKIAILDAYCPHLGANIAEGGKVIGNEVECPFHHWRFTNEGKCSKIPYTDCIPLTATMKSYPSTEWNGMILVYYDAEDRNPPYFPDIISELSNTSDFRYISSSETIVNMHICEFSENGLDTQHFSCLHGNMEIPYTKIQIPGITINHELSFTIKDHILVVMDQASLNFFGKKMEKTSIHASIYISGPGGTVYFVFETPIGKVILFHMNTPLEPLVQKVRFRYYAQNSVPSLLAHYIVGCWISQFQADKQVWENKVYYTKPLLAKNDGPVGKYRRWYNQFYSENSKNMNNEKLDW